jgi:hypothetical protein
MASGMSNDIRYIAEPRHVREVSLLGTADLAFWTDRLRPEHLVPMDHHGRARILISAATMTFLGLPFTEASFSILVCVPDREDRREAVFLLQGFNSSRLLAWCERRLFSTPYRHCRCRISVAWPASIYLVEGERTVFKALMQTAALSPERKRLRFGERGWEGPIFLPRSSSSGDGCVFFARICGHAQTYPFVPTEDAVRITPSPTAEVFQSLLDSQFIGEEWAVRMDATHARSRTYKKAAIFAGQGCD